MWIHLPFNTGGVQLVNLTGRSLGFAVGEYRGYRGTVDISNGQFKVRALTVLRIFFRRNKTYHVTM